MDKSSSTGNTSIKLYLPLFYCSIYCYETLLCGRWQYIISVNIKTYCEELLSFQNRIPILVKITCSRLKVGRLAVK